ncbi:uncharacterized protein TNCV_230461 [Trichonephila clavipes]|nr:uncharacterized protein TNCV_230461 [Trichonephila clavipes]
MVFRRGDNTTEEIVRLTQHIKDAFLVFVEFKSAFDKVWRKMLLKKLSHLNVSGHLFKWISDFLSHRFLNIKYGNSRSGLHAIAFSSDIKQAFLQICLANEHKDAVRFLWSDDEPCVHKKPKLQAYRFNRVNFGVSSSQFLLAATIRHIEKYKHEFPDTVELLDRSFYVEDHISGGNENLKKLFKLHEEQKLLWKLLEWISENGLLMMLI